MKYFTATQIQCVKAYSLRKIYEHQEKFVDFKFETLVAEKAEHDDSLFFINAVFTPTGFISSHKKEFEAFCADYHIPLDYSECL